MKNSLRNAGLLLAVIITGAAVLISACNKDNSVSDQPVPANKQKVSLYLSDDPGYFDQVLLDIRKVEVLVDTCGKIDNGNWNDRDRCGWDDVFGRRNDSCQVWDSLGIKAGVYDLLTLRNGTDTLLAGGTVSKGTIERIRITIGSNNSLVKNGVSYPVKSLTGQSKIVVRVRHTEWDQLSADNLRLWLDFDVQRSIIKTRDGKFFLTPYINVFTILKMGSLSGRITPSEAYPVVSVYNNSNDTLYALPWRDGFFKVRGLKPGTWNVFINPDAAYKDTTITNVTITAGKDNSLGTIKLTKK
ncbi:protein of unknown function [Chitinophaga jiangningensis]|uniref:DUF4382 domain-containing protein n=1 Tax=Chitinophaga jiangningensis TaxID=1419482 RepID=A0A1M7L1U3_9BACT|nr:DUF4382 domain-containing protein [Chitinophaga jiangningensis]SHM71497.1 protein of unknown function [Chitinophaga jiangningensis]